MAEEYQGANPEMLAIIQELLALAQKVAAMCEPPEEENTPQRRAEALLGLVRPNPHRGGFGYSAR